MFLFFMVCPSLCFSQITIEPFNVQKKIIYLPREKFSLKKLPSMKFIPFKLSDFHIDSEAKTVQLRSGKTLKADEFLREVNTLEEKLNAWGYTLKDPQTVKVRFLYPRDQLKFQKESLLKDAKGVQTPLTCEEAGFADDSSEIPSGRPKDFVPLDWQGDWNVLYGNGDFGVELDTHMRIEGRENLLSIHPIFDAKIFLWGNTLNILEIEKRANGLVGRIPVMGKEYKMPISQLGEKELFNEPIVWSTDMGFSIGPIDVWGVLDLSGKARLTAGWQQESSEGKAFGYFYPSVLVKAHGKLETGFKIADAGVDGEVTFVDDVTSLRGDLKYIKSPNKNFKFSAEGRTRVTLMRGQLSAYVEIDYLIGSKKFEIELYGDEGVSLERPLFSVHHVVPAEKDHRVWLKIHGILGVTALTARNEKTKIQSQEFDVMVDIGGRNYRKQVKDVNHDGLYGDALGEAEPIPFEIPLLSFQKVPIRIEVVQKYHIGSLPFRNALDCALDSSASLDICYDPKTRTFRGTKSGKENEVIRSVGNTSYWGERFHSMDFELTSESGFQSAPAKAK